MDIERHSPFQASLHPCKDYSNEPTPARILCNFVGMIYIHQVTVFLSSPSLISIKRAGVEWMTTFTMLGLLSITDLAGYMKTNLTFTYIFNKSEKNTLSSITIFIWGNSGIENVTLLEGRFEGVFCRPLKDSTKISTIEDALVSLGFCELRDFSNINDLEFFILYPLYRNFRATTSSSTEVVEFVEKIQTEPDFVYSPNSQTILVANESFFSDVGESDILVKTLFTEDYFPLIGVKYYDHKIFLIVEDFVLENFFRIPSSIATFCDQQEVFLDPNQGTKPSFAKKFWNERYFGSLTLREYMLEGGAKGRLMFNHLPAFVLTDFWLKGLNCPFNMYQG